MTTIDLSFRRILINYTAWWMIWMIVQTFVITYLGFPLIIATTDAVINNMIVGVIGFLLSYILRFYQPDKDNFIYLRLWAFLLAIGSTALISGILKAVFVGDEAYLHFLRQSLPVRFCYCLLMLAIIALLNWVKYHFTGIQEREIRKTDVEKMLREVELAKLRQLLQPHFLFNSLNSISALAGNRPEEARKMIQQLSDFLRGTLKKDDQQLVPLSEELQHLNLYLEIEKVRFGNRLNTTTDCDPDVLNNMLPSLLLQPIVENAIKFGLYDTIGEVLIQLHAKRENNQLVIRIKNPFDPDTARPNQGTGFGLSSVQRRLSLLYARADLLQTHIEGSYFITTVYIPQI